MVMDTLLHVRQPESGRTETESLAAPCGNMLPHQEQIEEGITAKIQYQIADKATPKVVHVAILPDDRLRLKTPVEVEMEQEGEFHIAKCDYLNEFGYGESPTEAIEDLQLVLVELYWTLKAEQGKLGPSMVEIWKRLHELIEEK